LRKFGSSAVVPGAASQNAELGLVVNTEVLRQKAKIRMMLNFILVIDL